MKTSVIDVHDMLSVLSVVGVEERIGEVPGVESVTVNFAAGNATVRFDETRLDLADIKSDVRQRGSEVDAQSKAPTSDGHEGHAAPAVTKEDAAEPVAPKTPTPHPAAAAEGDANPAEAPADKPVEPDKAP
ncbi:MAG: cation transporter [Polaromonas sp.]|uniref:heavy-metal-associated domain-containing protein n=1 Tax=Polaromonas sp. TaxID=1869339 RepID=UPI0024876064|nr:cation transporter [Polaromonas sp.]MDI1238132.1 cation transporter [Polaromonas sp.]